MRNLSLTAFRIFVNIYLWVFDNAHFGGMTMSRADELYIQTCKDILENGFYDTELEVRPHWEDGTPAHTVKKFGVVTVII